MRLRARLADNSINSMELKMRPTQSNINSIISKVTNVSLIRHIKYHRKTKAAVIIINRAIKTTVLRTLPKTQHTAKEIRTVAVVRILLEIQHAKKQIKTVGEDTLLKTPLMVKQTRTQLRLDSMQINNKVA